MLGLLLPSWTLEGYNFVYRRSWDPLMEQRCHYSSRQCLWPRGHVVVEPGGGFNKVMMLQFHGLEGVAALMWRRKVWPAREISCLLPSTVFFTDKTLSVKFIKGRYFGRYLLGMNPLCFIKWFVCDFPSKEWIRHFPNLLMYL